MNISSDEAWKAFLWNGVHRKRWPQNVYAVVFTDVSCYLTKNTTKTVHAEDGVIDYLEDLLRYRALRPQRVKLFLSASPCQRCSQRIITFLNTARWRYGVTLEMEVVFSAFYQIRRPSCEQKILCRFHLPSYDDHKTQVAGLKKLYRTQGVILRPFSYRDWLELGRFLELSAINIGCRQNEDHLLRKEFSQIMGFGSSTVVCESFHFESSESLSTTEPSTIGICIILLLIVVAVMLWVFLTRLH